MAHDDAILAQLGVKAELARKMGVFGNFAISFSAICNLAGGMSLFGYGLDHGRPVVMLASWIVIGFMTLLVGMSLADVVSAFPTSGVPYFMADKLGEPRWGWTTGWLNLLGLLNVLGLLGLLGAIAGIDYGAAAFIGAFTQMQWGVMPTDTTTILTFGCILLLHGLLNKCRVRLVTVLNSISVFHPAGRDAGRHPGIRCTQNSATGVPPAQIFLDVLGAAGAKALLLISIVAMLFCGNAEVADASRMIYAFSRSRAPAALADLAACQQSYLDAYRSCVAAGLCAVRPCTARPMVFSRLWRHHRDQRGRHDPRVLQLRRRDTGHRAGAGLADLDHPRTP
ncbi:hypothetical protein GCM10010270_74580 [Streptomyces violaceus]|nr:hypothetical protein GCM10010270_74580 [Streptomyces janthinus]